MPVYNLVQKQNFHPKLGVPDKEHIREMQAYFYRMQGYDDKMPSNKFVTGKMKDEDRVAIDHYWDKFKQKGLLKNGQLKQGDFKAFTVALRQEYAGWFKNEYGKVSSKNNGAIEKRYNQLDAIFEERAKTVPDQVAAKIRALHPEARLPFMDVLKDLDNQKIPFRMGETMREPFTKDGQPTPQIIEQLQKGWSRASSGFSNHSTRVAADIDILDAKGKPIIVGSDANGKYFTDRLPPNDKKNAEAAMAIFKKHGFGKIAEDWPHWQMEPLKKNAVLGGRQVLEAKEVLKWPLVSKTKPHRIIPETHLPLAWKKTNDEALKGVKQNKPQPASSPTV